MISTPIHGLALIQIQQTSHEARVSCKLRISYASFTGNEYVSCSCRLSLCINIESTCIERRNIDNYITKLLSKEISNKQIPCTKARYLFRYRFLISRGQSERRHGLLLPYCACLLSSCRQHRLRCRHRRFQAAGAVSTAYRFVHEQLAQASKTHSEADGDQILGMESGSLHHRHDGLLTSKFGETFLSARSKTSSGSSLLKLLSCLLKCGIDSTLGSKLLTIKH